MSYKKIIRWLTLSLIACIGTIPFYSKEIFGEINLWKFFYSDEKSENKQIKNQDESHQQTDETEGHKNHEQQGNHDHAHEHDHEHHEHNIVKLTENQIQQLGLQFRVAGPGALRVTISAPGKIILQPNRLAHIIPKVSGTALEAEKNIGSFVKAGEVLAILESRDMADMKAAYLAALSKQKLVASVLDREEKLYQENISPLQDYLNAKNAYEEALINKQLAQQKLNAFGLGKEEIDQLARQNDPNLRVYFVRSPIEGTVIMRHITKGEFIDTNTTIYEVADLRTVWVEIGIYPKDLNRVKQGQMVEIIPSGGEEVFQAPLIYVSPIVENETITAKAIAELNNFEGIWRPGTFVNVNITIEKKSVPLLVAKSAVQNSEGKDFVFVVTPEGFERRFVKLGRSDHENIEILSGLHLGDEYVANKTFLLKAELGKSTAEHHH